MAINLKEAQGKSLGWWKCILIRVLFTGMYTLVTTHKTVTVSVHFIICKFYSIWKSKWREKIQIKTLKRHPVPIYGHSLYADSKISYVKITYKTPWGIPAVAQRLGTSWDHWVLSSIPSREQWVKDLLLLQLGLCCNYPSDLIPGLVTLYAARWPKMGKEKKKGPWEKWIWIKTYYVVVNFSGTLHNVESYSKNERGRNSKRSPSPW